MKKILTPSIICLLGLPVLLISCSDKGGGTEEPEATRTELIMEGTWKYSSANWGGADAGSFFLDCQKDNYIDFVSEDTGAFYEGATRCSGSDPDIIGFNWSFQSGETVLQLNKPMYLGGSSSHTIVTLSATELTISQPYTSGGSTKTLTITFVH